MFHGVTKITAVVTTFLVDSVLLGRVWGLAVDTAANIYATGYSLCNVVSYSPDGTVLRLSLFSHD